MWLKFYLMLNFSLNHSMRGYGNDIVTNLLQLINVAITTKLKVQWCKLDNYKYMINSTQITNTEIFAFIAFLMFMLMSR